MKAIQHQIEINWPIQALFNYVSDVSNNAAWQRQVVNAEWLDGSKNQSGAMFVETRQVLGRELASTVVVTEFHRFKKRSITILDGMLKPNLTMEFEPRGEHTLMKLTIAFENSGLIHQQEELLARFVQREGNDNLERLKNILESSI